jgi:SNF2 family DNA or RNA helicase
MLQLQRRKRTLAQSLLGGSGSFRDLTQTEVDSLFSPLGT